MNFLKQLVGKTLLEASELAPWAKPWLKSRGLRLSPGRLHRGAVTIQWPAGKSFKLASLGQSQLCFALFWRGADYFEPITTRLATSLLHPGDTFLEVGAKAGFQVLVLTANQSHLRAVAFEPNPQQFRLLQAHVRANEFQQICCEPVLLSDMDGAAVLYFNAMVKVPTVTLDSFLNRCYLPGRMLIKLSVGAGQDEAFFKGGRYTFAARQPDLIVAIAGRLEDRVLAALKPAGYRFYSITDQGLVATATVTPVMRDRLVFSHYLFSARSRRQVAEVFESIRPQIQRLDLTQTNHYVDEETAQRFKAQGRPLSGFQSRVDRAMSFCSQPSASAKCISRVWSTFLEASSTSKRTTPPS